MPRHNSTSWKKGQSGNPKGRPPKNRALTQLLKDCAQDKVVIDDEHLTYQKLLSRRVWEFVSTGQVSLSDGTLQASNIADWIAMVKWLYTHVDGQTRPVSDEDDELIVTVIRELAGGKNNDQTG
jgi:hypothetical protein